MIDNNILFIGFAVYVNWMFSQPFLFSKIGICEYGVHFNFLI